MANQFKIVGIGEILWDMLPEGKQLGGAPGNFAYHCQQRGAEAVVISAIGQDELGAEILSVLEQKQMSHHFCKHQQYPTGTVGVSLSGDGIPAYNIHEQVAWDYISPDEKTMKIIRSADAICFGSLAQRTEGNQENMAQILGAASPAALKVFDINLRQHYYDKQVLERSLQAANILKLNDEELVIMQKLFALEEQEQAGLLQMMERYELKLIALTKGAEGSVLYDGEQWSTISSPKVSVVDTIGAGDAFTAAMVMGYLSGKPLKVLHQEAVNLSAYVCTQQGATPKISASAINQ